MSRAIKRSLDVIFSIAALIVFSPVLLIVAVAILVCMGPPVLFRHRRAGIRGQPFVMLKFRTMTDEKDENGAPLPDAARLTRLGRLLRKTSIDELPQLWNVLKGNMSLVGPRPLLVEYIPSYSPDQYRRHNVLPGIIGLPAVKGRAKNPWEMRLELDTYYVDNWSLLLDIKIILMAIPAVFKFGGVNEKGQATCCKFSGTEKAKQE